MKKVLSLVTVVLIVLTATYLFIISGTPQTKNTVSDVTPKHVKYIIDNKKFGYRLREINNENFKILDAFFLYSEKEPSIEIRTTKPRPVDFAWAALKMTFDKEEINASQLLANGYKEVNMFGKKVYSKDLNEEHYTKEFVFNNLEEKITLRVYLNNPSTKQEFEGIIEETLNKLEFY